MAGTIRKPTSAFSKDKPKRAIRGRKPVRLDAHRKWVKSLPSLISGHRGAVEVAHISLADSSAGKTTRGKGQKTDDFYVVPLSIELHREAHKLGEKKFQAKYALDLVKISMALFLYSGQDDNGELICQQSLRENR